MKKYTLVSLLLFFEIFQSVLEAAPLFSINKTPYEQRTLGVDFSEVTTVGNFSIDTVVATNLSTRQDATALVIVTSPAPAIVPATTKVVFSVKGGLVGQSFLIGVRVIDSVTSARYEGEITVVVTQ